MMAKWGKNIEQVNIVFYCIYILINDNNKVMSVMCHMVCKAFSEVLCHLL